jgi:hypothetical protein
MDATLLSLSELDAHNVYSSFDRSITIIEGFHRIRSHARNLVGRNIPVIDPKRTSAVSIPGAASGPKTSPNAIAVKHDIEHKSVSSGFATSMDKKPLCMIEWVRILLLAMSLFADRLHLLCLG